MILIKRNDDGSHTAVKRHVVTGIDGSDQSQEVPYILPGARKAVKLPIPVPARRMVEDFEVETLEGTMSGKAGDYLMTGVNGEMYPCDAEIFNKTYRFV